MFHSTAVLRHSAVVRLPFVGCAAPSWRPLRWPPRQAAMIAPGGCLGVEAEPGPGAGGPGAQLDREVGEKHQLVGCPVGVAGHQLIQDRAVRLGDLMVQQRGGGDHQHTGPVVIAGRVKAQAEVAVRHPAGLHHFAVRVTAELLHWPRFLGWWGGWGTRLPGRPAAVLAGALPPRPRPSVTM